jgi:hypothetical protein
MYWRAVCGKSRMHGSVRAVEGQPSTATLQVEQCSWEKLLYEASSSYPFLLFLRYRRHTNMQRVKVYWRAID